MLAIVHHDHLPSGLQIDFCRLFIFRPQNHPACFTGRLSLNPPFISFLPHLTALVAFRKDRTIVQFDCGCGLVIPIPHPLDQFFSVATAEPFSNWRHRATNLSNTGSFISFNLFSRVHATFSPVFVSWKPSKATIA